MDKARLRMGEDPLCLEQNRKGSDQQTDDGWETSRETKWAMRQHNKIWGKPNGTLQLEISNGYRGILA